MDWKKMQLKRHALTGISYMIPVVVAGGLCMGLAKVFGGWDICSHPGPDWGSCHWFYGAGNHGRHRIFNRGKTRHCARACHRNPG